MSVCWTYFLSCFRYFARADGSWRHKEYITFWYGIDDPRLSCDLIKFTSSLESSFVDTTRLGKKNTVSLFSSVSKDIKILHQIFQNYDNYLFYKPKSKKDANENNLAIKETFKIHSKGTKTMREILS